MAKIEKQIAEAKGEMIDSAAFIRLVINYKVLLCNLNSNGYLTDEDYDTLVSECQWCGENKSVFEELRADVFGWKCHHCGKIII